MAAPTHCFNACCRRTTPSEGRGGKWHLRFIGPEYPPRGVTLCVQCKNLYDQGNFCLYCFQIYRDSDDDRFDGKEWIGCDNDACQRWTHQECELKNTGNQEIDAFYLCPACRTAVDSDPTFLDLSDVHQSKLLKQLTTVVYKPGEEDAESLTRRAVYPWIDLPPQPKEVSHKPAPRKPRPMSFAKQLAKAQELEDERKAAPSECLVDFGKLDPTPLRRYQKHYNLPDRSDKIELVEVVKTHFARQSVLEPEVVVNFIERLKAHRVPGSRTFD